MILPQPALHELESSSSCNDCGNNNNKNWETYLIQGMLHWCYIKHFSKNY